MNALNSIVLEGNLTRDAEHLATPKGTEICRFAVASNRYYQQDNEKKEEVSFFDIEAWGRTAENCKSMALKGRGCRVVGRLKQDKYTDSSGKTHSRVKIVADHVEFRPLLAEGAKKAQSSSQGLPAF